MRWVNHYTHPGDTRYQVFVFAEAEHAHRFEHRCTDEGIPFEKHEENGEVLFGIAKTHFAKALRANHLVHAEFRTHFIPHRGWRWGLLVFTGTVLALAVLGWLTSSSALGQVEAGMPWELDILGRVHVPSQVFGMEPTFLEDNGITATWSPKVGSEFGLRIHRRLKEGWTVGGGLEHVRREHAVVVMHQNDTLGIATADTMPQMRSLAYRIPLVAGIRLPLGWKELEWMASGGVGLEWKTSETIVQELIPSGGTNRVVEAFQGRTRYLSVPVIAELGLQRRARRDRLGWYIGWYWSSPLGNDAWVENTWASGSVSGRARDFIDLVVTGLDVRLVLPE